MIPSPLHPALVHFPIALILLGTLVSAVAVFQRRWNLPWIAAGLLACGAAGAVVAAWSGGQAAEMVGELGANVGQVLENHEEWGESARNISIVAALLAICAAAAGRIRIVSGILSVVAALAALASSYCVANAGHLGGELVYDHGLGVNIVAESKADGAAPKPAAAANAIK